MMRAWVLSAIFRISLCLLEQPFALAAHAATDETEVRAVLSDLEVAVNQRDSARILEHAADDVVMITKNGAIVRGKTGMKDYLEKMFGVAPRLQGLRSHVVLSGPVLRQGNMLLAVGTSEDEYRFSDGMQLSITTVWSATLVRAKDKWKVANIHFSFNLFDNPLLNGARMAMYLVAVAAALLGGLTYFLCMRFLKRQLPVP